MADAEVLKARGNTHFRNGEYEEAIKCYSQAIQRNSSNYLLWTNRANARLKLELWEDVITDCLRSIELHQENMKAYFYLAQAQYAIHHPNEALSSAIRAYELCVSTPGQTSSAFTISALVLKCKKAKWEDREKRRLHARKALLAECENKIELDMKHDIDDINARLEAGTIGRVEASEEKESIEKMAREKISDLRTVFSIADPEHLDKREVPDYLVDQISFEIMHDPVVTKHGHSYERATITEHLKRNPIDPLTRRPLTVSDLRPNIALKQACDEFFEKNWGWAIDW